jgi:hypothetical protein
MIGTITPEEPAPELVRCVPRTWVVPSNFVPKLIWDDSGAGGKKGSIWVVNSLGLMAITEGHDRPNEIFYELWSQRFIASQRPVRDIVLGGATPKT